MFLCESQQVEAGSSFIHKRFRFSVDINAYTGLGDVLFGKRRIFQTGKAVMITLIASNFWLRAVRKLSSSTATLICDSKHQTFAGSIFLTGDWFFDMSQFFLINLNGSSATYTSCLRIKKNRSSASCTYAFSIVKPLESKNSATFRPSLILCLNKKDQSKNSTEGLQLSPYPFHIFSSKVSSFFHSHASLACSRVQLIITMKVAR